MFCNLYYITRVSLSQDSRAFSVVGPQTWNQLPKCLHQMDCISTFTRHYYYYYFLTPVLNSQGRKIMLCKDKIRKHYYYYHYYYYYKMVHEVHTI